MKIASFNIKHHIFRNNTKISNEVFKVIQDNNIDILCTQEIPRDLARSFQKNMEGYTVNGDSRYHRYLKSLPFNEKNPILTKYDVVETKTIRYRNKISSVKHFFRYLQHAPIFPRIVTIVIVKIKNDKDLCIINTHLDYKLSIIQKSQLNQLLEIICEYMKKYKIVLLGDFNMDLNDEHFVSFIELLKSIKINMVNISKCTWRSKKGKERAVDYIFLSDSIDVKDFGIIKSNRLSDHDIIYVEI